MRKTERRELVVDGITWDGSKQRGYKYPLSEDAQVNTPADVSRLAGDFEVITRAVVRTITTIHYTTHVQLVLGEI